MYQQVRTLLPDDAPPIALSYLQDGNVTLRLPNDTNVTLGGFEMESNSVLRGSYVDDLSQDDTRDDLLEDQTKQ